MLESESRRITQKEERILLAFGTRRRALFTTKKKRKKSARTGSTPGRTCMSFSDNEVKRGRTGFPLSSHLANHMRVCVCVILSLSFSYLILGVRVSPRSQQQLHSCRVTIARGLNESSDATLTIEGEVGTHHSSKGRRRRKRREVSEVRE